MSRKPIQLNIRHLGGDTAQIISPAPQVGEREEEKDPSRTNSDATFKIGLDVDQEIHNLIQLYNKRIQRIYSF